MSAQPPKPPGQQSSASADELPHQSGMVVPFFLPSLGDAEIQEVVNSLRNGWITTGPKVQAFEDQFAEFIGGGVRAVSVNSATAGLHLALEALGISAGDEVIVPVNTFTASAEVVRYLGATPRFVDIDYDTMNMNAPAFRAAITERTKAVIPVHIAGLPMDMAPILDIAKKHDLKVVEDAAHVLPANYRGERIGSLASDATVFSFYATKTITTGEGGMITTRNDQLAQRCRQMRLHGIDRDAFARRYSDNNSWRYDVIAPGYKYNMTDVAASIGIHQLARAEELRNERESHVQRYKELLDGLPLTLPADAADGDTHAWHLFIVRLTDDAPIDRDTLIKRLSDAGIICSVHFIPLHKMTYWRELLDLKPEDFPNAERNFERCLSLPLFPTMTSEQIDFVAAELRRLLS